MPVADYQTYCKMLDRARDNHFAYPAINVSSLVTANAVLKGLAESRSDGIIQVSTGGGAFASGSSVKDMALGAISIAEHVHRLAERYDTYVALHTDHCQPDLVDTFMIPLIEETERRRASGLPNLFNSHMFDGSGLPLKENLDIAVKLLKDGQEAVEKAYGKDARFYLVFHGGSGSSLEEIRETLDYGVVKMNIDTDTQYAFTRPIADHVLKNYDGVLKVDGEVGSKKAYDPRVYLNLAEASMAERVKQAAEDLRSAGTSLLGG